MDLPETTPPAVRAALAEAKARLGELYGDRLARVVLYGSRARGDAGPDSDVDLLVVLHREVEPYAELKGRLVPLAVALLDRYGLHVSLQPYGTAAVADRRRPLMWNIAKEGVEV